MGTQNRSATVPATKSRSAVAGPGLADDDDLSLDEAFSILKNQRRRRVLRYLRENEPPVELRDLAEHIAALENDTTVEALSSTQRKRVYVGLYQCHLPKLDDAGVIDCERSRGRVELGPNADQLDQYLVTDDESEEDRDWLEYAFGVASGGGTAVALTQLGVTAPSLVTGVAVGAALTYPLAQRATRRSA